jgi:hypothetical protein
MSRIDDLLVRPGLRIGSPFLGRAFRSSGSIRSEEVVKIAALHFGLWHKATARQIAITPARAFADRCQTIEPSERFLLLCGI